MSVELISSCVLPTRNGRFEVDVYRTCNGTEALLMRIGDLTASEAPFVRVHSQCLTGEVLGSLRCDCEGQLHNALRTAAHLGRGAIVYLMQEGRGIGLANKIRAYAEQDKGADTVEANQRLGFPADLRDFSVAAEILKDHGVQRVRLYTNNPDKVASLEQNGVQVVEVLPAATDPNPHNHGYLKAKHRLLGHAGLAESLRRTSDAS